VALLLLEFAALAIEQTAREPDGSILVVALDNREGLAPVIERCQAGTKTILDALFSRRDGIALAWAWLERMLFRGKLRGRPSASDGGLAVNLPTLAIIAISERLCWRHDWKEWIGERKKLWRIYRITSVLAIGTFGQEPDKERLASALNWALLEAEIDYAGIEDAIADQQNVVAAIGGRAICTLRDPVAWFTETWQKLRPIREKNWRTGVGAGKHNSVAELLMLWGFAAHGFLPPAERSALWASLEKSLRDAWQTDALVYPTVWSNALVRLFGIFEVQKGDGTTEEQMASVLFPYAAARRPRLRSANGRLTSGPAGRCAQIAAVRRRRGERSNRPTAEVVRLADRYEEWRDLLWVRHFQTMEERRTASGAARVPQRLQCDVADREARLRQPGGVPPEASSTRRQGGVGFNPDDPETAGGTPWARRSMSHRLKSSLARSTRRLSTNPAYHESALSSAMPRD